MELPGPRNVLHYMLQDEFDALVGDEWKPGELQVAVGCRYLGCTAPPASTREASCSPTYATASMTVTSTCAPV